MERLDKFLCDSGLGTRSQVKLLLKTGRVTVDGRAEKDGSRKIDPQCQQIALDGDVKKIAQSAYLFCPHNMEIQGDLETLQAEVESYV